MNDNVMSAGEYCEEYERVTGTPAPRWLVASMAATQGMPDADEVPPYVFCGYGTKAQAEAFVAFCDSHGIKRRTKVLSGGHLWQLSRR
jgi:hypothetical protein